MQVAFQYYPITSGVQMCRRLYIQTSALACSISGRYPHVVNGFVHLRRAGKLAHYERRDRASAFVRRRELADDWEGVARCYDDSSQCLEADCPLTVLLSDSSSVPYRGCRTVVYHLAGFIPREPQDDDPIRKRVDVSRQSDRRSLGWL